MYVKLNEKGIFICDSCGEQITGSLVQARHINISGTPLNHFIGFSKPDGAARDRHYHPESWRGCWERPSNDVNGG